MGFFSSKKTIVVSSTLYNLAGDEEARPDFLKSTVFSHTIGSTSKDYLGDVISKNYLDGPGIKQRQFLSWSARNSYEGMPAFVARRTQPVDLTVVSGELPVPTAPGEIQMQSASIMDGDYVQFAEERILDVAPEKFLTNWVADYDEATNNITIHHEDLTVDTFSAGTYDYNARYLVAYYYVFIPIVTETEVPDSDDEDETIYANVPDTVGYTFDNLDNTIGTQSFSLDEVTTVVKSYSNGDPDVTTTSTTTSNDTYDKERSTYYKTDYIGTTDDSIETKATKFNLRVTEKRYVTVVTTTTTEVNDMGGGETETVTTTVDTDTLTPIWDWEITTQNVIYSQVVDGYKIFIYKMGSGNTALDALEADVTTTSDEFYPAIPVRIANTSIQDTLYETSGLYNSSRKAYKKAFGDNGFNDLISNIEDNDSIDDIDYSFVVFGVPLNVIENASRKYIYEYLKSMIAYQTTTPADLASFQADILQYELDLDTYMNWLADQNSSTPGTGFGSGRPTLPTLEVPQETTIKLKPTEAQMESYDFRVSWYTIQEEALTGLAKIDAKNDEVWLEKGPTQSWTYLKANNVSEDDEGKRETLTLESIIVYHQIDSTSYRKITAHGLRHQNYVYKGKAVETSAHEALDAEDESGFLIPLHGPTVKAMGLVDATQMATANTYIVFNSYEVVKQKWYQSSIFKILLVIAVIVISVLTFGVGGLAAGGGLLGTNLAVGTTLGLTGSAALIAGAAANALAAIALSQVIKYGATELFGEQLGGIIAAIATFVVTAGFSAGITGGFDFSALASPSNILKLTSALANGYQSWQQAEIAELTAGLESLVSEYETLLEDVDSFMMNLGGINDLSFNPLELTNVLAGNDNTVDSYVPETIEEFIHRTTMVGSDVADVTLALVTDYTNLALTLPKN